MGSTDLKGLTSRNLLNAPAPSRQAARAPSSSIEKELSEEIQISSSEILRFASVGSKFKINQLATNGFHYSQSVRPAQIISKLFNPFSALWGCSAPSCPDQDCSIEPNPPEVNAPPEFINFPENQRVEINNNLRLEIKAKDPEYYSPLEVRMEPGVGDFPSGARFTELTNALYEFTWTPREAQLGWYSVGFVVKDQALETKRIITIEVVPPGHAGTLEEYCSSPGLGKGNGTPEDPYSFNVLVVMDEATRLAIEQEGWNIQDGIDRMFFELNSGFNNGQLAGHYRFTPLEVRYFDDWKTSGYPQKSETAEDEDIQIFFDIHYGIGGASGQSQIWFGSIEWFNPGNPFFLGFIHEVAHTLGAVDLYKMGISYQNNSLYPGSGYSVSVDSYMEAADDMQPEWDPTTAGILNASGNDLEKAHQCYDHWMKTWIPNHLSLQVVNSSDNPIEGAQVKVFRYPDLEAPPLSDSSLWHSGSTNSTGLINLPQEIAIRDLGFYYLFLGAVSYNGNDYLNWFDITHLATAYLEGNSEFIVKAEINESTLYVPPNPTDLEMMDLQITPEIIPILGDYTRKVTFKNNGTIPFDGRVAVQYYVQENPEFDSPIPKTAAGGRTHTVSLPPGETATIETNGSVPGNLTPGTYYFSTEIESAESSLFDTNQDNNMLVSVPITIISD